MATIEVNNAHYNLATVSGIVTRLIRGTSLGGYIYVYGIGNDYEYDYYFDTEFGEDLPELIDFFKNKNIFCTSKLPSNPNNRPAIAIRREARDDADLAAKVCLFTFLFMNGRLSV